VRRNYGHAVTIVFDGYESCTKDEERARRSAKSSCADVSVFSSALTGIPRETFLNNINNKKSFINLLIVNLENAGNKCLQAKADADRLIMTTAIDYSHRGHPSVVIGEDTDLLVLLICLTSDSDEVYMRIPGRAGGLESTFSSAELRRALRQERDYLLFLHAVSGCDSTSALYRKGKAHAFKTMLKASSYIKEIIAVFTKANASPDEVSRAGEVFLVMMYGGPYGKTLNDLRPVHYQRIIAKQPLSARFDLAVLPPTSASARQHSFRVYLQVQEWLGRDLSPTEWGWQKELRCLTPLMTTMPPAPDDLLQKVSCGCQTDCSTQNCSCKAAGIPCGVLCGLCAGDSCLNRATSTEDEANEGENPDEDPDDPDEVDI
jgi:hypothetical protein